MPYQYNARCIVPGCNSRRSFMRMHRIPGKMSRAIQWLELCKRTDLIPDPYKKLCHKVCRLHFKDRAFSSSECSHLTHYAFPEIFPWDEPEEENSLLNQTEYVSDIEHFSYEAMELSDEDIEEFEEDNNESVELSMLCRMCAQSHEEMVEIFSSRGVLLNLQERMLKILSIQVLESDQLPLRVCRNCIKRLNKCFKLQKSWKNAEIKLQAILHLQNINETFKKGKESEEYEPVLEETQEPITICCQEQLEDQLEDPEAKDTSPVIIPEPCTEQIIEPNDLPTVTPLEPAKYDVPPFPKKLVTYEDIISAPLRPPPNDSGLVLKKQEPNIPKCVMCHNNAITLEDLDNFKENFYTHAFIDCISCNKPLEIRSNYEIYSVSVKNFLVTNFMEEQPILDVNNEENTSEGKPSQQIQKSSMVKKATRSHKSFWCDVCNKRFYSRILLQNHSKREHNKEIFFCLQSKCKKSFSSNEEVENHRANDHTWNCQLCLAVYNNSFALKRHMNVHQIRVPIRYQCSDCNKSFSNRVNLREHKLTHDSINPYVCEKCGETFRSSNSLRCHFNLTHLTYEELLKNDLVCMTCNKIFGSRCYLMRHMNIHSSERLFKCPVCEKSFKSLPEVQAHKQCHSNIKTYLCHICASGFKLRRNLLYHIKYKHTYQFRCRACKVIFPKIPEDHHLTHSELDIATFGSEDRQLFEKATEYLCKICDRYFFNKMSLTVHTKLHYMKKSHACGICDKSFISYNRMKTHRKIHFTELPTPCHICNKYYSTKKKLSEHMIVHGISYTQNQNNTPFSEDFPNMYFSFG